MPQSKQFLEEEVQLKQETSQFTQELLLPELYWPEMQATQDPFDGS